MEDVVLKEQRNCVLNVQESFWAYAIGVERIALVLLWELGWTGVVGQVQHIQEVLSNKTDCNDNCCMNQQLCLSSRHEVLADKKHINDGEHVGLHAYRNHQDKENDALQDHLDSFIQADLVLPVNGLLNHLFVGVNLALLENIN
jgi:hypothetical protein